MFIELDVFTLLSHTTPVEAVDPHLAQTLRERFASWAAAQSLSPIGGRPDLRYAGRLANRDVEIGIGVSHDERGAPRVGACLVFVACPELTPLVPAPIMIGAHSTVEGDAADAMLLFVMQGSPVIASVALAPGAVCVRLMPGSGPPLVDRSIADVDGVLRGLYARRSTMGGGGPYRSG